MATPFVPAPGNRAAYGRVPAPIIAPNPFEDVSALLAGLGGNLNQASANVGSGLRGELSNEVLNNIQDDAAVWNQGAGLGASFQPGTIAGNRRARDIGLTTYKLQQDAMDDMLNLTQGTARDLTLNPALNSDIQSNNNTLAAAPDPFLVAQEQSRIWAEQFNALHPTAPTAGMGGGGGGGGVNYASVNRGPHIPSSAYGPWSTIPGNNNPVYTGNQVITPNTNPGGIPSMAPVTDPAYQNPNLNSSPRITNSFQPGYQVGNVNSGGTFTNPNAGKFYAGPATNDPFNGDWAGEVSGGNSASNPNDLLSWYATATGGSGDVAGELGGDESYNEEWW